MNVGQNIKKRRNQIGMSAESLAEKLGCSPVTIYRYENGAIEKVDSMKLVQIAEILRTTPAALITGHEDNEEQRIEALDDPDDWIPLAPGFDKMPPAFQHDFKVAVNNVWKLYHDLTNQQRKDEPQ